MAEKLNNQNLCVETPAAPEWLSKLENRREQLSRPKLGHELGAGAPCTECGDKCPGLDLHFWRKVCRNCKCRKDQHQCADNDLGWAQFEVLGQIRSKPAYIKIKALASRPIQVEWVPPNVAPDVVSDYMEKLGSKQIPVAGSDAANKRKQQLVFQVPPHDLDASLCDNLSEKEKSHLQQYVLKIRDNCVGQGIVVRIGAKTFGIVGHMPNEIPFRECSALLSQLPHDDPLLVNLLASETFSKAIASDHKPMQFQVCSEPIARQIGCETEIDKRLSNSTKALLKGYNMETIESLVGNGAIFDKILDILKLHNLDISQDTQLEPIANFRALYHNNPQFRAEISAVCGYNNNDNIAILSNVETVLNSPLPLKYPERSRYGHLVQQETPMKKLSFGTASIIQECGLPAQIQYEKDPVFAQILYSEPLKNAIQCAQSGKVVKAVVISSKPLTPDFDFAESSLQPETQHKLQTLKINTKSLQSAVVNGAFYDNLFENLVKKNIPISDCHMLTPIRKLRQELLSNIPLRQEINRFVADMPSTSEIAYVQPEPGKGGFARESFEPLTPNQRLNNYADGNELGAIAGKFASIPGIEELNMYPTCKYDGAATLTADLQNLDLNNKNQNEIKLTSTFRCHDCTELINFGEVAVKAKRAGKDIAWHPDCFKCFTCRELLADLVYFFYGGEVYCGRDLAIRLKVPRCKACDELIFTKEYTAAEGANFHIKHFCCYHCDTPLAGQQYIPDEKTDMPLCLQCYHTYFAASCQRCGSAIGPADQGVAWKDIHWHTTCFLCANAQCSKSLMGGRFCVKENKPFCSPICANSILK